MSSKNIKKVTISLSQKEYDDIADLIVMHTQTKKLPSSRINYGIPILLLDQVKRNRTRITKLRWFRHQHIHPERGIDYWGDEGYTYPSIYGAIEYMRAWEGKV